MTTLQPLVDELQLLAREVNLREHKMAAYCHACILPVQLGVTAALHGLPVASPPLDGSSQAPPQIPLLELLLPKLPGDDVALSDEVIGHAWPTYRPCRPVFRCAENPPALSAHILLTLTRTNTLAAAVFQATAAWVNQPGANDPGIMQAARELGGNRALNYIYEQFETYVSSGDYRAHFKQGGRHTNRWMPLDRVLGICYATAASPITGRDALFKLWRRAQPGLKVRYQPQGK